MHGISRRFLGGWLVGAGLGLVLVAGSAADDSERGSMPDASPPPPAEIGSMPEAPAPPTEADAPDVSAPPPAAVTVVGEVAVETSDTGGVRVIQIVDAERRVLIVEEVGAGRALAKHEGERVSATGVVSRRKDGREVLLISSFQPLGG